jgi:hypothetical protein
MRDVLARPSRTRRTPRSRHTSTKCGLRSPLISCTRALCSTKCSRNSCRRVADGESLMVDVLSKDKARRVKDWSPSRARVGRLLCEADRPGRGEPGRPDPVLARKTSRPGERAGHAARRTYRWCRPPTLGSATTFPSSLGSTARKGRPYRDNEPADRQHLNAEEVGRCDRAPMSPQECAPRKRLAPARGRLDPVLPRDALDRRASHVEAEVAQRSAQAGVAPRWALAGHRQQLLGHVARRWRSPRLRPRFGVSRLRARLIRAAPGASPIVG